MPKPWERQWGTPQPAGPSVVFQAPPDPMKAAAERRAEEDQAMQRANMERAQANDARQAIKDQRDEIEWNATHNPDGTKKPVPGAATEGERKAASFLTRALGAEKSYGATGVGPRSLIGQGMKDAAPDLLNALPGFIGNSPARQVADTNQDEFIAATLRQDSGAVIPPEEMERQRRIYFPMPNEGPEVIEAKRQARIRALQGLVASSGAMLTEDQKKALAEIEKAAGGGAGSGEDRKKQEMLGTLVPGDVANKIEQGGLTPEQQAAYDAFNKANPNATADQIRTFSKAMGWDVTNADDIVKAREQGGGVAPASSAIVRPPNISDARGEGGAMEWADAFVRGAADTLSLGFSDELAAAGDTLFKGGTMDDNLRRQRAIDRYDAEYSPWLRGGGQLAGGLAFPIGRGAKTVGELAGVGGMTGAGYGFGSGETMKDRFTGAAMGGAAGAALGAGFGKLGEIWKNKRPPSGPGGGGANAARDVGEAATDLGIDILPADVGGPTTRRFTAGAAQSPFGAKPIIERAERAAVQGQGVRDAQASRYATPSDGYGAGQSAKSGLTDWIKKTASRASRLYDAISVAPEMEATTSSTTTALNEITKGMKSNDELSRIWTGYPRLRQTLEALTPTDTRQAGQVRLSMETEKVRGAVNDLQAAQDALGELKRAAILPGNPRGAEISAAEARVAEAQGALSKARSAQDEAYVQANQPPMGGKLSWQDMKRLRSIVGEIVGSPSLGTEGSETSAMRKLYGALSEDMRATAEKAGPKALREFERANDYFRARENRIKNVIAPVLGKDLDKGGQAAFNQIQNWSKTKGETAKLAQMMRSLPDDEADIVSATIIANLGRRSAGAQNAQGDAFSFAEFLTHWNQLDNRAKAVLFKPAQRTALEKLAKVSEGTKEAQRYANFSNSSGGLGANATSGGLVSAAGLLFTGHPILAAAAASPAVGQYITGRMMASPQFVNWLLRAPKQGPGLTSHIKKLGQMTVKSPLLSSELSQFEQALFKATNDNVPMRSAASVGQEENSQRQ